MRRLLWWLIAGARGGVNRAKIIDILNKRPRNVNQLAEMLQLDYKTIKHHIDVLHENGIIISSGGKYGKLYFLSGKMEDNYEVFLAIWDEIKEENNQ